MQLSKKFPALVTVSVGMALWGIVLSSFAVKTSAQTTCTDLGSSFGSVNYTLNSVQPGSHKLWIRMKSADGTPSIKFNLSGGGSQCNQTLSTTGATAWKWVQSSSSFTTTGGTVSVQLAGTKAGDGVDCFVLTSDTSFTPSGTAGCLGPHIDTTPPSVSFTSPVQNAAVSGIITARITASDTESGIQRVVFSVSGNSSLNFIDTAAPYEYSLNTTLLTNGNAVVSATATNNAGLSISNTRSIVISNSTPAPPKSGDVNGDNLVNFDDFFIIRRNFNAINKTRAEGDLNGDTKVDFDDFFILRANFR